MPTLPTWTVTLDDLYTDMWVNISSDIADNVRKATPVSEIILGKLESADGGEVFTETIRTNHGPTPVAVNANSTLPFGDFKSRTQARWYPKYLASPIQRNTLKDDIQNRGPDLIINNVKDKISMVQTSMKENFESLFFDTIDTSEASDNPQGLNTIIPVEASRSTGTYGGIARPTYAGSTAGTVYAPSSGNTFWGPTYLKATDGTQGFNYKADLTKLLNGIMKNRMEYRPDLIVCSQSLFELYENFVESKTTIVKDATTRLADLGFEVLRFKGIPLVWSEGIIDKHTLFLNTAALTVKYDPMAWYSMTPWQIDTALTFGRIAHILCSLCMYTKFPTKFGRLYYA